MKKRSWMLFTVMVIIWGLNWAVMKVGLRFIDPLNLVMQRLSLASVALLPVLILRRRLLPRDFNTWLKMILLSLINAFGILSTNLGLMYEASGLSSLLTYTQPIFVFCLAVSFLGEKATLTKVFGVILGFLGVFTLYASRLSSSTNYSSVSILLLILGAFLWAVTVIYYKKLLSHVDPVIMNIIQFPIGSIFLLALILIFWKINFSFHVAYIFSLIYISVLASALAASIWLFLIREEETIIVSTSSFLVPAIALIFGSLFLKEPVSFPLLIAFMLILVGIYFVNRGR
ncbi:DMT family transporter [Candidatus Bathyarchaeota archaeon]|nr:DMT family transporter [Candidatus Bathyarchaeota archaeon]